MISIAPLAVDGFEIVARWISKPDINRWLSGDWRDKDSTATTIAIAVRNRKNRLFLVSYEGRACGLVALSDIDHSDKTAMVWYLLGEDSLTGKGIVTEAVAQLVAFAFEKMALESLYAWAMECNAPSVRVLGKAGFRPAGRIRRSANMAGQQVDRLYFDCIQSDLAATAPNYNAPGRISI